MCTLLKIWKHDWLESLIFLFLTDFYVFYIVCHHNFLKISRWIFTIHIPNSPAWWIFSNNRLFLLTCSTVVQNPQLSSIFCGCPTPQLCQCLFSADWHLLFLVVLGSIAHCPLPMCGFPKDETVRQCAPSFGFRWQCPTYRSLLAAILSLSFGSGP